MTTTILTHPFQTAMALVALQYGLRELFHGAALLRPALRTWFRPIRQLLAA